MWEQMKRDVRNDEEVYERINKIVLRWFGHIERMENDSIVKRVYVGERGGSPLVCRTRKRRNDFVN